MTEFPKIEKDVKLPEIGSTVKQKPWFIFLEKMEIGDSFTMKMAGKNTASDIMVSRLRTYATAGGFTITARKLGDTEMRIWKTKPKKKTPHPR